MVKFHINDNGDTGECNAEKGNCPFGGDAQHYATRELAREAFELSMSASSLTSIKDIRKKKRAAASQATRDELNYQNLLKSAVVSETWEGAPTKFKISRLREFSHNVPFKAPVMIRLTDGTIIFDEAGHGYTVEKPSLIDRFSAKPEFSCGDGANLWNFRVNLSPSQIDEVAVFREMPDLPKEVKNSYTAKSKTGVGSFYAPKYEALTKTLEKQEISEKDSLSIPTFVETRLKESMNLGYWDGGIWRDYPKSQRFFLD